MFASFDHSKFPLIRVTMNGVPESDNDFNLFLNTWLNYYHNKKDFKFIFDTTNVGLPHIKYSIKMSLFIKELKKKPYQYLKESIIIINNNKVKWLLDFIFTIQPPVAPVYIYKTDYFTKDETTDNINTIKNCHKTVKILPSKSIISLF